MSKNDKQYGPEEYDPLLWPPIGSKPLPLGDCPAVAECSFTSNEDPNDKVVVVISQGDDHPYASNPQRVRATVEGFDLEVVMTFVQMDRGIPTYVVDSASGNVVMAWIVTEEGPDGKTWQIACEPNVRSRRNTVLTLMFEALKRAIVSATGERVRFALPGHTVEDFGRKRGTELQREAGEAVAITPKHGQIDLSLN